MSVTLQRQRDLKAWAKGHGAIRFLGFDGVEYEGNLVQVRKGVAKLLYRGDIHGSLTAYIDRKDWDRITLA